MTFDFRRRSTSLRAIVLVSFVLQVATIAALHTYKFRLADNHFGFGWEMGRVGQAIAQGKGFSNPYGEQTGPTAWEPPLYPYLIGGVFKVFGIYSNTSAFVLLTINSLFSALTCIPIFLIARQTMGEKVAVWSAWIWALLPYVMYWSVHWIWDTTLTPLLLSLVFLVALQLGETPGNRRLWIQFGLLWGLTALANPSTLSFLPVCLLWVWYRRFSQGRGSMLGLIAVLAIMAACLSPWLVRNFKTFGRFVFVRDDFGLQLRLGNGPYADGLLMAYLQPNLNVYEMERFRQLGELRYGEECKRQAFDFIREHPGRFAVISVKRFVYYWAGVPKPNEGPALTALRSSLFLASSVLALWGMGRALRKRKSGAWLFALLLLSYPTVYYFVYPHARYRHVIEPELLILAVFLVLEAERKLIRKRPLENKRGLC
jgi:4-amino-4-deoxy-L-arabinose transferase-like glycosyltransferase